MPVYLPSDSSLKTKIKKTRGKPLTMLMDALKGFLHIK